MPFSLEIGPIQKTQGFPVVLLGIRLARWQKNIAFARENFCLEMRPSA
jgi:hypothetical protein